MAIEVTVCPTLDHHRREQSPKRGGPPCDWISGRWETVDDLFGVSSPVARWVPIPLRLIVDMAPWSMGTPSFLKDRIHCRDSTGAGSPSAAVELCAGLAVRCGDCRRPNGGCRVALLKVPLRYSQDHGYNRGRRVVGTARLRSESAVSCLPLRSCGGLRWTIRGR